MAKIHVEAYGCSASFADSEMISGIIVNNGHKLVKSKKSSDLNLIVTCSVKDATANKMIHRIKSLSSNPLVVAGCLPKAERKRVEKFAKKASLLGPNSLNKTLEVIQNTLAGKKFVALEDTDTSKTGLPKVRLNPTVGIIEIASGCLSECTFCQTKISKGDLVSYRIGDIVRQAVSEIDDGCKEIWLTSTDNGCYGLDIGTDLPTLIDSVCEIPRDFRIRIGMMNPMYMPKIQDKLLKSFENYKVYKFIHVPVQSGSNNVLKEMKRGHTAETFKKISKQFRKKYENFTIATDIIVGFPTETTEDFEKTIMLLKETKPDVINLSKYSARPGTIAANNKQIKPSEIKRRSRKMFDLINKISLENNKKWIGWRGEVLFDEKTEQGIKGRNFAYKPVFTKNHVKLGEIHNVVITKVTNHSLIGQIQS